MRRYLCSVLLCGSILVLTTAGARTQTARAVPASVGLDAARLDEATALLKRYVTDQKIAGAVAAVARKGKVAYLEAVGVQDLQTRAPMTEGSIFRIYSMTKAVTSVAVMILHEEGKFTLTDPVAKYLPEFKNVLVSVPQGAPRPPARDITIEDLMLHTSGLNHRTSEIYRREQVRSRSDSMSTFLANLVRVPLMEDPGTRYRYSEGTSVLGRLVEIWSGQSFEAFLDERVLRPLKMVDTGFVVRPEQRARFTTVYALAPTGGLTPTELETVPFTERPALIEGAVGLVSTVPDFMKFSLMLSNKGELDGVRILSARTVDTITKNGLSEAVLKARGGPMGWGLANVNVLLNPTGANPANVGEYGWDGSAGTIFWIDPSKEMVTILMTQSAPANPDSIRQRFKAIVQQAVVG